MTRFEELGDLVATRQQLSDFLLLGQCDSTNSAMSRDMPRSDFSVIATLNQTGGRGRMGREWLAKPGECLALSVCLPSLGEGNSEVSESWIPLILGACLSFALGASKVPGVGLKWPNDILINDRKLAGILCEKQSSGQVIAGIGLNLCFEGDPPLENAIDLSSVITIDTDRLDKILSTFFHKVGEVWNAPSGAPGLVYSQLQTIGKRVEVTETTGKTWSGEAVGLDSWGHLVVNDGIALRSVVASDIRHLRH